MKPPILLLFNVGCMHLTSSNANQVNVNQANSAQTNTRLENDNFHEESAEPTISPAAIPDAVVNKPYNVKVSIFNFKTPIAEVSVKDGQMSDGITMKTKGNLGEVAEISGIPTQAGTYKFAVLA